VSTTFITRPWQPDDVPFLWEMLYESIHVREGQVPPPRSIVQEPGLAHYLEGFGRVGDDAQVAVEIAVEVAVEIAVDNAVAATGAQTGSQPGSRRIGAAWCRRMTASDPGYGFVDDETPELGTAVIAEWRGRGVGTRLIQDLMERNPAMSLSVDDEHDKAKRLYERLGFVDVGGEGTARTMLRRPAGEETPRAASSTSR
jgi:ribosomal protein S18 acetylase RimI-like enzyme